MSESSNSRVGQKVSNYNLVRLIGHGGFADVYLGEHIYLKTPAAIKILHIRAADADQSDILNEARTIAQLEHPHIVRMFEYGVEDGYPFLIMSYAAKGSLRNFYPKGVRLPVELVIAYAQQMAAALDYAHKNKLIHRDVKPENMLIGQNDQLLLTDFGLVMMALTSRSQKSDDLAGTVAYMAPEQLRGRPRFASDQYALGVVVYEWLCGKRPFVGSFAEIASQQMLESPPSLREMVPDLSPEIEQVVFKALAKNPSHRFETVGDFAHTLVCAHNNLSCLPMHLSQLSPLQSTNSHSFKLHSSNTEGDSTQPLITLSSLKLDTSATMEISAHNPQTAIYDPNPSPNTGPEGAANGSRSTSNKQAAAETITPDGAPATFPTFRLAPRSAQIALPRRNKNLRSTFILVMLLLIVGGSITLGFNQFMSQGASSQQNNSISVPATTSGVSEMIGSATVANPTNTPVSIPTMSTVSTQHTILPPVPTPVISIPATQPAQSPATSAPTPDSTPDPDTSTPTSDPSATPTPDPDTTTPTPDPSVTPTPGPSVTPNPKSTLTPINNSTSALAR